MDAENQRRPAGDGLSPEMEFYNCPDCGERIYDREAMLKIEFYSPAYHKAEALVEA
jgi:hypothetical protein